MLMKDETAKRTCEMCVDPVRAQMSLIDSVKRRLNQGTLYQEFQATFSHEMWMCKVDVALSL